MTERRGQEARPGAVHLQRLHLEEWNVWELDIELELEGGVGGAWGARPWNFLYACLPDLGGCCQALLRCPSYTTFLAASPPQIVHSPFPPLSC